MKGPSRGSRGAPLPLEAEMGRAARSPTLAAAAAAAAAVAAAAAAAIGLRAAAGVRIVGGVRKANYTQIII